MDTTALGGTPSPADPNHSLQRQNEVLAEILERLARVEARSAAAEAGLDSLPRHHALLADIAQRLQRLERQLGGAEKGLEGIIRHTEQDMRAVLRRLYLEPSALPAPYSLTARRFRIGSQNEEDGITWAIFQEMGVSLGRAIEIGCGANGGNSGFLVQECGWSALMVDADEDCLVRLERRLPAASVTTVQSRVTRENVNQLVAAHGFAGEVDLLSIDVDGNDYWIWDALEVCKPRVVIVEYNSLFGPDRAVVVPYDPEFYRFNLKSMYYGASLGALAHLGRRKGYRLVATEPTGVNAYFLRDDLCPSIPPCDVAQAYRMLPKYAKGLERGAGRVYQYIEEAELPLVEVDAPISRD
jgi:hypothetical protein